MRKGISVLLIALVMVLAVGCSSSGPVLSFANDNRVKVATSFYPLYEITRAIGGGQADVVNMIPPGTEPHDWEPTAKHLKLLGQAKLFVYNGAGMEPWVEKTLASLDNKALPKVEATRGVTLHKAPEGEGHGDHEPEWDPHVWLDPLGAIRMAESIRDGLINADAANRSVYEANAAAYIGNLQKLHQEYKAGLTGCKRQTFFTSHSAFGYLAGRYNLTQQAIMGLSPESEPKPKDLARIVAEARAQGVKYIFFETLVSDKVSKVVAQEVGARTLVLNPFEGLTEDEVKAGQSYFTVMANNLANLRTALECGN